MRAIDTETHLIAPGNLAPRLVCLSFAENAHSGLVDRDKAIEVWRRQGPQVYQNAAFDLAVLIERGIPAVEIFDRLDADQIHDTMLREKLLDIAEGCYFGYVNVGGKLQKRTYSLAALARKYIGVELDKDTWRLRYSELDGIPIDRWPIDAQKYATDDAITTLLVYEAQEERRAKIKKSVGLDPLADEYRQVRRAFALHLMAAWGICTDKDRTDHLEDFTLSQFDRIVTALSELGLCRPDGSRNTKAAQEWMRQACKEAGIDVPRTAKGAVCLNKDACEQTADQALSDYASLTTLRATLSRDVEALRKGHDQPIHTRINTILETGRPSSSAPNIFNIRSRDVDKHGNPIPSIRECFIPRKGRWFLQADFSGLELCTLGQVLVSWIGHSKLASLINKYGDAGQVHTEFAVNQLGVSKDDPGFYEARQTAKVANFGFPGGLGIQALTYFARAKYGVHLTQYEASKLKKQWLCFFPEMREYFKLISDRCEETGYTRVVQLFSNRIRGRCRYTQACNSPFQGLGADATGLALYALQRECYADPDSILYGARIVNYVYDEFILEVPQDPEIATAMSKRLVEVSETEANRFLPDVPVKMGDPVLMTRWSKSAKPKFENGFLVPST